MITVDRFEGDRAVIEVDGEMINIPMTALPVNLKEGDSVEFVIVANDNAIAEEESRLKRLQASSPQGNNFDL